MGNEYEVSCMKNDSIIVHQHPTGIRLASPSFGCYPPAVTHGISDFDQDWLCVSSEILGEGVERGTSC